jgi:hypothetical protein
MVAPLEAAVRRGLRRALAQVDDTVLAPLGLARRAIVLVAPGELATVPWTLLPSRRGCPTVVAPSASAWARASQPGPVAGPLRVRALTGPYLNRAGDEVAAVAHAWGRAGSSAPAERAAIVDAVGTADVLHIAAHGLHQADSPLFSWLRLHDGPLFAHEIDPSDGRVSHVVLSACDVGRATLRPGDEALGLTSVLLHFGVRSVVAGVGRVRDADAAAVMVDYHRRLAAGTGSAQALASALAAVEENVVAPFVCFGSSWSAALPTRP